MERNNSIDLAKYIASLMVVAIHTALFRDINGTLYLYFINVVCRTAVPFFAMCTGYFVCKKAYFENGKITRSKHNRFLFFKQWRKIFILYCVWSLIYMVFSIPKWIEIGWFSAWAFVDYMIATITKGSYYHLWYLLSLIYALPVVYLILRKIKLKYILLIAGALYTIKVLAYGYINFLPESFISAIQKMSLISGVLDGFFCITPFILSGAYIAQKEKMRGNRFIMFIISMIAWCLEMEILRNKRVTAFSYLFSTVFVAYFSFYWIANSNCSKIPNLSRELGTISLYIYCVHPIFIELVRKFVNSTLISFIIVSSLSTLFGVIMIYLKKHIAKGKGTLCLN